MQTVKRIKKPSLKRDHALKIISKHRDELHQFKVKSISIFGSVARNEAGPKSDIDILVDFSEPVSMFEFLDLKEYLEKLFKRRVDLATREALRKQMRDQILKEAIRA